MLKAYDSALVAELKAGAEEVEEKVRGEERRPACHGRPDRGVVATVKEV